MNMHGVISLQLPKVAKRILERRLCSLTVKIKFQGHFSMSIKIKDSGNKYCGLNCIPPKDVEVLTISTYKYGIVWKQSLQMLKLS